MTEFDFDVMQKKSIARGAYHRKGGSRSKRCSLPSDNLTPAQKRALNGPVTTVTLGQPMTWEGYKALSDSLRKEYLEDLIESYQVSGGELGRMLAVSRATMCKELNRLGVKAFRGSLGAQAKAHRAKWEAFCNGVVGGAPAQQNTAPGMKQEPEREQEQEQEIKEPDLVKETARVVKPQESAQVSQLRTTFQGVPNLKQLNGLFDLFVQPPKEVTVIIEAIF